MATEKEIQRTTYQNEVIEAYSQAAPTYEGVRKLYERLRQFRRARQRIGTSLTGVPKAPQK